MNVYHIPEMDRADLRQFCGQPVTPYRVGFEHATYQRVYASPYPIGSRREHEYRAGHEDGRAAIREA